MASGIFRMGAVAIASIMDALSLDMKVGGMRGTKLMLAAVTLAFLTPAGAAKLPATWDGLVEVKSKQLAAVYLRPDADFRAYNKVMFQPAQASFQKDWQQNYNAQTISLANQVTNQYVQSRIADVESGLNNIFPETFAKEGYQVVTAPGPGVALIAVGVLDLSVTAPDVGTGFGENFAVDAGEASLVVEVLDSVTKQLLARGLDRREAGTEEVGGFPRSAVSNREDFKLLFQTWATIAAKGLTELRASSPIDTDGIRKQ